MIIEQPLVGKFVIMRSVEADDATFILGLRLDENNTKFLGKIDSSILNQNNWINQQRSRANDYYFLYTDKEKKRLGVISVYNIEGDHAESGRFVSCGNSMQNMEAVLLHYDFAYYTLGLKLIHFTVYKHNKQVANLWKRLGSEIIREVYLNNVASYYFELTLERYENFFRPKLVNMLDRISL